MLRISRISKSSIISYNLNNRVDKVGVVSLGKEYQPTHHALEHTGCPSRPWDEFIEQEVSVVRDLVDLLQAQGRCDIRSCLE
jgi:hypothetical protein